MPNRITTQLITPDFSGRIRRGSPTACRLAGLLLLLSTAALVHAQAECNGYGGLRGIRIDGQLMPFTTGLRAERASDHAVVGTANERTRNPTFTHVGNVQTCTGGLAFGGSGAPFSFADRRVPPPLAFVETFTDRAPGTVDVHVRLTSHGDFDGTVQFVIDLPPSAGHFGRVIFSSPGPTTQPSRFHVQFNGAHEQLECITSDSIVTTTDATATLPVSSGLLANGAVRDLDFTLQASGDVDHSPATLTLDPSQRGPAFLGIGGNFRLQNPAADPAIIAYNLDHLRLAWARLAMPLNLWQPDEGTDPTKAADAGQLNPQVRAAMEMGRTLAGKGVPMIISVWSAPEWALGPPSFPNPAAARRAATMPDAPHPPATQPTTRPVRRPTTRPLRGRAVRPEKLVALCRSITAYLLYAKMHFDFEPALYSFNESDLGIDVRQTPADQDQLIRTLGPMLQQAGLKTKLLLGDTSDATPTHFIDVAMNDPAAVPFIGAVSFHSWRGGTDQQLSPWGLAAKRLNVPLLVAEGGTDAAAYAYPAIFEEPWFALDEIGLYTRICALDQPASILEWQLTSDYSILTGWRDGKPLTPTMRFWQLQQLDQTPPDAPAVLVHSDNPAVQACAYLDATSGAAAIHLTNAGPAREVTITGLPPSVRHLRRLVTDHDRGMAEAGDVAVEQGTARVALDAMSFTSLLAGAR